MTEAYDASDLTQKALYYWSPGEPDFNTGQYCGFIWFHSSTTLAYGLGNMYCTFNAFEDTQIKGLCEICESWQC